MSLNNKNSFIEHYEVLEKQVFREQLGKKSVILEEEEKQLNDDIFSSNARQILLSIESDRLDRIGANMFELSESNYLIYREK